MVGRNLGNESRNISGGDLAESESACMSPSKVVLGILWDKVPGQRLILSLPDDETCLARDIVKSMSISR